MKIDLKKVDHPAEWRVVAWDIGGVLDLGTAPDEIEATEIIVNYLKDGGPGNVSAFRTSTSVINGVLRPDDEDDDIPLQAGGSA